jgi:hypothetical protein
MSKKNRLSRDQKRKAKLAKETRRARGQMSALAYTGSKYKKDEYVPLVMATEQAIHEADVMTERELTDQAVQAALEKLVLDLRHGPLAPLDDRDSLQVSPGREDELVARNIRRHWVILAETEPHWGPDAKVGVLRTLLNSLDTWRSPSPRSRGYLHFLEGFMKKLGVRVDAYSEDMEPLPEREEDELLAIGRRWCEDGDRDAEESFRKLAKERMAAGQAESVVEAAQALMGEYGVGNLQLVNELGAICVQAQRRIEGELR